MTAHPATPRPDLTLVSATQRPASPAPTQHPAWCVRVHDGPAHVSKTLQYGPPSGATLLAWVQQDPGATPTLNLWQDGRPQIAFDLSDAATLVDAVHAAVNLA